MFTTCISAHSSSCAHQSRPPPSLTIDALTHAAPFQEAEPFPRLLPSPSPLQITGKPWQEIEYTSRDTDSKKYRSLTIQAPVANADQLYQIYEAVGADPRVRGVG
jgi:hypothetical protein